jgi:hypothetical protein
MERSSAPDSEHEMPLDTDYVFDLALEICILQRDNII